MRAYARSGCLVELDLKLCWLPFYRFPSGLGEPSLSPFAMWRLHGSSWRPVSVHGPPTLLHCKNNRFCNISYAMEAPWRLVEARLCTGLQRFCTAKTMDFVTSHMPWRLHGSSWRPVSVRASTAFLHWKKQSKNEHFVRSRPSETRDFIILN